MRLHIRRGLRRHQGFSLIELAFVLLITGLLLGTLSSALVIYFRQAAVSTTKSRLKAVDQAIQDYLMQQGNYPCAASLTATPDTATYGTAIVDCNAGAAGTTITTGTGGRKVIIGAVPTRTINVPDDYALDAWGNRMTYAVTIPLALPNGYDRTLGAISIVDAGNNSIITPAGSAHYAIISHGPDGRGATTAAGVAGQACPASSSGDGENCNNNAVFRRTVLTSSAAGGNHFDDLVTFTATSNFGQTIPPGAVMAFNLATCPNGWNLFPLMAGRVAVGGGSYSEAYTAAGRSWSASTNYQWSAAGTTGGNETWMTAFDELGIAADLATTTPVAGAGNRYIYTTGSQPATAEPNMPPYLVLTYCQKS